MKRLLPANLFLLIFLFSFYLYAGKITVINTANSGAGSLRNAVASASSGDTIIFSSSLSGQTITLTTGSILLNKNLVITGPGASSLALSGNSLSRIFYISPAVKVKITNIKLINGKDGTVATTGSGGAVFNNGAATFENMIFQDNNVYGSPNNGGAIYNTGPLTLYNCTFLNNGANGYTTESTNGGAIYSEDLCSITSSTFTSNFATGSPHGGAIFNTDTMRIIKSTFNGNQCKGFVAALGGAIYNVSSGDLEIVNSTLSGNSTSGKGGALGSGLYNDGIVRLVFSTVTLNQGSSLAPLGGGFYNNGILALHSALVAGNSVSMGTGTEDGYNKGYVSDFGYNLIGISNAGLGLNEPTNITGTPASPVNPVLGPLLGNGGLTHTHALLSGSPAIDAGNPFSLYHLTQDQRGFARPYNSKPDIGSFEWTGAFPVVVITGPHNGDTFTTPATVHISASATGAGEGTYLRILNPSGGYRKIKLGYDPTFIYKGSHNVLSSGNNKLEITIKDLTGTADWTKIQVRSNGNSAHPLTLAPYVVQAGGVGNQFVTLVIPLGDFDPAIDFTQLTMLELPYSTNAAPFDIGIEKIMFTGGTSPFLFFGDGKTNNAHDGTGGAGELLAALVPATGFGGVQRVEFYNGSVKIGEDYTPPYAIDWKNVPQGNYALNAIVRCNNGTISHSATVHIVVVPGISLFDVKRTAVASPAAGSVSVYPNPVQDKLTISAPENEWNVLLMNETGTVVYERSYNVLPMGEADLSGLPSGVYILRLEGQDSASPYMLKLLKQ